MKRKKIKKHPFRNAALAPRTPRASRPATDETPLRRLAYTAGGALGTALTGSLLARQNWAEKTIATALTAVGAGLAWKGDAPTVRSIGAGVMSAAGSQLALMVINNNAEKHEKKHDEPAAKKPANASNTLPPGSLESALARAKARLAASSRDQEG
jgi:hypothetical protein